MDIAKFSALPAALIDDAARNKLRRIAKGAHSYVDAIDDAARKLCVRIRNGGVYVPVPSARLS